MENTIAIASLQIGYQQKTVVKNINLTVRPGEILGMLGPNAWSQWFGQNHLD